MYRANTGGFVDALDAIDKLVPDLNSRRRTSKERHGAHITSPLRLPNATSTRKVLRNAPSSAWQSQPESVQSPDIDSSSSDEQLGAAFPPALGPPSESQRTASPPLLSNTLPASFREPRKSAPLPTSTLRDTFSGGLGGSARASTAPSWKAALGARARLEQSDNRFANMRREHALDMHRDLCAFRDRLRVLSAATHTAIGVFEDLLGCSVASKAKDDPLRIGLAPTTQDVVALAKELKADHANSCDKLFEVMISKDDLAKFSYSIEAKDLVDSSYHFVKRDHAKQICTRFQRKVEDKRHTSKAQPAAAAPVCPDDLGGPKPVSDEASPFGAVLCEAPPATPLVPALGSSAAPRRSTSKRCSDLVGIGDPNNQQQQQSKDIWKLPASCQFGQEVGEEKLRAIKLLHSFALQVESNKIFPEAFQVAVEMAHENDNASEALFMPTTTEMVEQVRYIHNLASADVKQLHALAASRQDLDTLLKAIEMKEGDDSMSESSYMTKPSTKGGATSFADLEDVDPSELPHNPKYAAYWGLTVDQLKNFHDEIIDNLDEYCQCHDMAICEGKFMHLCHNRGCTWDHVGMATKTVSRFKLDHPDVKMMKLESNMHMVVGREVKPRTLPHKVGFSLSLNPKGLRINVFISHTWGENFREFVGTLNMALDPTDVIWICSLALDQNSNVESILNVPSLNDCPFAVALKQASKQVVALDHNLSLITRAWCVFELSKASQWNVPMALWFMSLPEDTDKLMRQVAELDLGKAGASMPEDVTKIRQVVEEEGGYEKLNSKVQALLTDRLKFSISMQKNSGLVSAQDLADDKEKFAAELAKTKKWMIAQERQLKFRQLELEKELTYAKKSKESRPLEELLAEKAELTMQLMMVGDQKAKLERDLVQCMETQLEEKVQETEKLTETLKTIEEEKEVLQVAVQKQESAFKLKELKMQQDHENEIKKGWSAGQRSLMSAVKKISVVNKLNPLTGLPEAPAANPEEGET